MYSYDKWPEELNNCREIKIRKTLLWFYPLILLIVASMEGEVQKYFLKLPCLFTSPQSY